MSPALSGLHHVTAITGDPRLNADFYTRVLGLRLVKRTVNFDQPDVYHLYYGDATGRPGTILTFFARLDGFEGRAGNGQTTCVRFGVPLDSFDTWTRRLSQAGVSVSHDRSWCDAPALSFRDPEGLALQLIAIADDDTNGGISSGQTSAANAVLGLHSVALSVPDAAPTGDFLTAVMNFNAVQSQGSWRRFAVGGGETGLFVDVHTDADRADGVMGAGCVHHIAFRASGDGQQRAWQDRLRQAGRDVTEIRDRKYFQSIYFDEPAGIRLEIATDTPGFAVDEPAHALGRRLQLPPSLEPSRERLEQRLGPLPTSSA